MSRVRVWARDGSFDAALAQLPDRVERAESPRASILVIDGRRERAERVTALLEEGPLGVVLTHPSHAHPVVVDQLERAGIAVVTARPLLRADDTAAIADAPVRHVLVDAVGARADIRSTLVDAVGWGRIVAGGDLEVAASARTRESLLAALRARTGIGVTLAVTRLATAIGPAITVDGIGERRIEVRIDHAARLRDIRLHTGDGALLAPARFETSERLALRRALAAVAGAPVLDLGELAHDLAVAEELLGAAAS